MKSIVLLLWLSVPTGADQFVLTQYVDDQTACARMGQALVDKYAASGEKARFQCHEVVEEASNVDENGNPVGPIIMHANNGAATP